MIKRFKHKGLKRLYTQGDKSKISTEYLNKIENILFVLDNAAQPEDLDLPGFRLHPLSGALANFWSVRVSANWRIIFRFEYGDAFDVDLVDYH